MIDAFDQDIPFDEFITKQLAGDLLPALDETERAHNLIATGYLAVGAKGHNTRSRREFQADLIDEQIDAFSQGILGITVACARCHDHKYDPIPQADYYAVIVRGSLKARTPCTAAWLALAIGCPQI